MNEGKLLRRPVVKAKAMKNEENEDEDGAKIVQTGWSLYFGHSISDPQYHYSPFSRPSDFPFCRRFFHLPSIIFQNPLCSNSARCAEQQNHQAPPPPPANASSGIMLITNKKAQARPSHCGCSGPSRDIQETNVPAC